MSLCNPFPAHAYDSWFGSKQRLVAVSDDGARRTLTWLLTAITLVSLITAPTYTGGFITTPTYAAGPTPVSVAVGDFNGDGRCCGPELLAWHSDDPVHSGDANRQPE